jgi:hypothetical protein
MKFYRKHYDGMIAGNLGALGLARGLLKHKPSNSVIFITAFNGNGAFIKEGHKVRMGSNEEYEKWLAEYGKAKP